MLPSRDQNDDYLYRLLLLCVLDSPEIFEAVDAEAIAAANLSVDRSELPEAQPLVVLILVERIQMLRIFMYRALTAWPTRRHCHAAIVLHAHFIFPLAFSKSAVAMTKEHKHTDD